MVLRLHQMVLKKELTLLDVEVGVGVALEVRGSLRRTGS
jgi:hypothetical protein